MSLPKGPRGKNFKQGIVVTQARYRSGAVATVKLIADEANRPVLPNLRIRPPEVVYESHRDMTGMPIGRGVRYAR